MKKKVNRIAILCFLIVIVLVCIICAVLAVRQSGNSDGTSESTEEEAQAQDYDGEENSGLSEEEEELQAFIEDTVYDVDEQEAIREELEEEKEEDSYTPENILVEYNPFGTNTQSLYIYFETEKAASVSYTVHTDEDGVSDYSHEAYQDEEYQTEHEFQVIGLYPDSVNTVSFDITYEDGSTETAEIEYEMGSLNGDEEIQLEKTEYSDSEELEDGLYVILGNDDSKVDFMYYYDNDGIIRGEVPIIAYRAHRLLFDDDTMFYSISKTQIARMDRLGQIIDVYDLGEYKLHHDYVFDDDGNILILATDTTQRTEEDCVVMLDVDTGEVTEVIDFCDYFTDYMEECVERADEDEDEVDWFHLNTIQWMGDDSILLSAREVSTIVKVTDIYDNPEIEYLLGSEDFWEELGYEDLVYEQDGDFTLQGGQHSITYVEDDSLEDGQYYIYMFNNNIGVSNSNPDFDWSSIGLTNTEGMGGDTSYYYEYLVDENDGTFTLTDSFEVPYSGYVSSAQNIGTHTIIDSGIPGIFSEYDENHELIASFTMETEKYIYRVYKYEW